MNRFLSILLSLLIFSCSNQTRTFKRDNKAISDVNRIPDFNVALSFINSYANFCAKNMTSHSDTTEESWILTNKLLTERFKSRYKNILDSANNVDPELGLDFDPIFDAQDFPNKGFNILTKDSANGYLTVIGNDLNDFKLVLKLTKQNDKWLVDGAGIINIPKDKRAKR